MSVYGPTREDLPSPNTPTSPARQSRKRPRRFAKLMSKLKRKIEKLDVAHKATDKAETETQIGKKPATEPAAQSQAPAQQQGASMPTEQQQQTAGQAHVAELEKHGHEVRAYSMEINKPMSTAGICLGDTTRQSPTGRQESGQRTGPPQADTKEAAEKRQQRRKKEAPGIHTPQEGVIPGLYSPHAPPSPPHTPPHVKDRYETKLKDLEDKIQQVATKLDSTKKARFGKEETVRPEYGDVEYADWDEQAGYDQREPFSVDEPYVEEIEEAREEEDDKWPLTTWQDILAGDEIDNPNIIDYVIAAPSKVEPPSALRPVPRAVIGPIDTFMAARTKGHQLINAMLITILFHTLFSGVDLDWGICASMTSSLAGLMWDIATWWIPFKMHIPVTIKAKYTPLGKVRLPIDFLGDYDKEEDEMEKVEEEGEEEEEVFWGEKGEKGEKVENRISRKIEADNQLALQQVFGHWWTLTRAHHIGIVGYLLGLIRVAVLFYVLERDNHVDWDEMRRVLIGPMEY